MRGNPHAAARLPNLGAIKGRAREIRRWLRVVGIQWEPEVFVLGRTL